MAGLFKDEIDILYTASNKLTQASTPVEQLEAASDYARSNGASTGVLFHMDSMELEVVAEWYVGQGVPLGIGSRYQTATLDFTKVWLAQPGRPTLIYDTLSDNRIDPQTRDFFVHHQIIAVAVLPLNNKGRWMGVLMFGWSDPYLFDERDLRIFTALQQQAAPVIDSVRLFEQTQKRAFELEIAKNEIDILYAASNKLTRALTPPDLLEAVSDYAREHGATAGLLAFLYVDASGQFEWAKLAAEWTTGLSLPWGVGNRFPVSDYVTSFWEKSPDQPILISDSLHSEHYNENMRKNAMIYHIASSAFLPLNNQGRWVGIVVFNWSKPYQFTERDHRIYKSLQQQAAAAIDSVQLFEQAQRRAMEVETAKNEIDILYRASSRLTRAATPAELLEAASEYPQERNANAALLIYIHLDSAGEVLSGELVAEWARDDAVPWGIGTVFPVTKHDNRFWMQHPDQPVFIEEPANSPFYNGLLREITAGHQIGSAVFLPLSNQGRWVGLMIFHWGNPYTFGERDERIFQSLLQQAAPVIDSVRLFEQVQKRAVELENAKNEIDLLYEASNQLTRAATPAELLEAASSYARENGASAGLLAYLFTDSSSKVEWAELIAEWTADNAVPMGIGARFPTVDYAADFWENSPDSPFLISLSPDMMGYATHEESSAYRIVSSAFLPLKNRGRWVGLLVFNWSRPYQFTEQDTRVYQSLIQQIAPVIDSMRLLEENRERAARAEYLLRVNTALSQATNEVEILEAVALYTNQHHVYGMILSYVDYDEATETGDSRSVAIYKDGKAHIFEKEQHSTVMLRDESIRQWWIHQPNRVLFIENVTTDSRLSQENRHLVQENAAARALALLPLYSGRGYKGILTIYWDESHVFSEEEKYIYTELIQPISSIVASRRAYLAEEEARQESEFLYRMSKKINVARSFEEIVQAVASIDPVAQAVILNIWENYDYDKATYLEVAAITRGDGTHLPFAGQRYPKAAFPIAEIMPHDEIWVIEDIWTDPRVDPVTAKNWESIKTRALIGTTLWINNRWVGGLTFHSSRTRKYTAQDIRLTAGIGELVVAAFERIRLQAETEASRQQAEALAQVNAALSQARDERDILAAVSTLAERYGAKFSSLSYARGQNHNATEVEVVAIRSADEFVPLESLPKRIYRIDELPFLHMAHQNPDELVFVENVFTDSRAEVIQARTLPQAEEAPAIIDIPLKARDQWHGMLSFIWTEPQTFNAEMRTLFKAIQPTASAIVATRRAYLIEQQRAHELETVAKVSAAASQLLDVQELLDTVVLLGRVNFERYHIFIYLVDETGDELVQATGIQNNKPLHVEVNCKTSLVAQAACSRRGMFINDTSSSEFELTPTLPNARSEVAVPMIVGDKFIGVLDVQSSEVGYFSESDIWVMGILADLTAVAIENARLYTQAQELAVLEERNRLARELHDSVSQALYGIALGARTARALLDRNPARLHEPLDYVLALAEGGLTEMRALIFELRPESLENEGLITALSKQAAALQVRHGLKVNVDLCNEPDIPLDMKESLYRIAREALHNTIKHAQASEVNLTIKRTDTAITLQVSDNGIGFEMLDSFPGHLGLQSMRERTLRMNGTIEVESSPGQGTRIFVSIPADYKTRTMTMKPVRG
ncbi:MAG: GAF domain-containing protein [Anaerolineae bacterium]|nr:GAF domain-containing protein [Anaerolineae bacterium]